jgi:lipopolysaccharide biosynthesis regulator YciM
MEAGLEALNQGQDQEAIQIFETFCQNAVPNSREHLQAQMHLVKTHQNRGQMERAIALCQVLLDCPNAQVQIWAQQTMKGLGIVETIEETAEETEAVPEIEASNPS